MRDRSITLVRAASLSEACSWLALLFVAMPLKYLADRPLAVSIVGGLHGALFVWLCAALLAANLRGTLSFAWAARIFGASFIPFLPFFIDRRLRSLEAQTQPRPQR